MVSRKLSRKKGLETELTPRMLRAITAKEQKIATTGVPAKQVEAARSALQNLNSKCIFLSEKYNEAAIRSGQDARQLFDKEEVNKDRETLNSLFADEYSFVDPFGLVGNKETTVEAILAGKVRKDAFTSTREALQIHSGGTLVSSGTFSMKGSMKVRFKKSGVTRKRDISGEYQSTHTYVEREGRLLLA